MSAQIQVEVSKTCPQLLQVEVVIKDMKRTDISSSKKIYF